MLRAAVAGVGRRTRTRTERYVGRARYLGAIVRAALHYPATTRGIGLRVVCDQVRFTAVQALPFVSAIALVIGVTVVVQAHAQAARFGFSEALGQILVTVVVRELGPLLTAVIVIGRSGTAIAAELATNGVLRETEAMEAMGVDPLQYLVVPRVIGAAVSVALLAIYFDAIVLVAGSAVSGLRGVVSPAEYAASLRLALRVGDLWLTVAKGAIFGVGIAVLCSYEGLLGGRSPTDIPQCVTRGVVASLLFVFVVSTLFSLALHG